MTYDMSGSFSNATAHQSPLYCKGNDCFSVSVAIQAYLDAGCTPQQLNMGVPFYAHQFNNVVASTAPDKDIPGIGANFTGPTESTCQTDPKHCVPTYGAGAASWKSHELWDDEAQASYSYDVASKTLYSYDNTRAIVAKKDYATKKGLGGFMFWVMGADDSQHTLLSAISKGL